MQQFDPTPLAGTHDLRLSPWGPYTKRYMGISHLPDLPSGLRFDLSVFPGLYRRGIQPPNVTYESGYHPWAASGDLSYYRHRFDLLWKDRVYVDIDFCRLDDQTTLICCECVNNTDEARNLVLHYMASLHFPRKLGMSMRKGAILASNEAIRPSRLTLPKNAIAIDALSYVSIAFASFDPAANLVYDGLRRGEIQDHGFVEGFGLGQGFGCHQGDRVSYRARLARPIPEARLLLRHRMPEGGAVTLNVSGDIQKEIRCEGAEDFTVESIKIGDLAGGDLSLTLTSQGGAPIELDTLVLCSSGEARGVRFDPMIRNYAPQRHAGPHDHSMILKYDEVDDYYGLAWPHESFILREIKSDNLDIWLRKMTHNHRMAVLQDPDAGEGHFTNVFLRPIHLAAQSSQTFYGWVCSSTQESVQAELARFDPLSDLCQSIHQSYRRRAFKFDILPEGEPYRFSQDRMAATMLTNVVYPIRTRGQRIRHYTPGRWWDSVYTWDSGFIGLGLLELDVERAIDNLNTYMTTPGDDQAAFVHHGSPVPVQHYLFHELWNRTQSRDLLEYFYPRLRQFHQFLAGRLGSSTTRNLKSNLIRTWDYFHNSGGWDDYPPQVYLFEQGLFDRVTPVVNTAHMIRTARILRTAALALGEDATEYEEDIHLLTEALQDHAWDSESGYFGYVCHDEQGRAKKILREEGGVNFNMGMDGATPLIAGACTPEQEDRLVEALMTPGRMWSPVGITTVDQTAPYYNANGYWNGTVWMPYQWFFWKTMLDLGRTDEAHRIAKTALDLWKHEVDESYNCYEHFPIETKQGAGWHHFGGLSSPVLSWMNAYHRPGRLTVGLDIWVDEAHIDQGKATLEAELHHVGPTHRSPALLATLSPDHQYGATWNDQPVTVHERYKGTLEISLPANPGKGKLRIGPMSS